jgi:hypothetical protein
MFWLQQQRSGDAYLLAGCVEEAQRLAQRGLAHARAHKMRGHQAWTLWLLGDIAARHNPPQLESAAALYL